VDSGVERDAPTSACANAAQRAEPVPRNSAPAVDAPVSDTKPNPEQSKAAEKPAKPAEPARPPSVREVWQIPALLVAGVLLAAGAVQAMRSVPKPDYSTKFEEVRAALAGEKYEEALDLINANLLRPMSEPGALSLDQQREFHLSMARALYLGQKSKGIDHPTNNQNIIDEYTAAEQLNQTLEPKDIEYLARALISMDELGKARGRLGTLPEGDRVRRTGLQRAIIAKTLDAPVPDKELALDLITAMLADPDVPAPDQNWALARQSELRIDEGFAEQAINGLLRRLPLGTTGTPEHAELFVLLGRAYLDLGRVREADEQFERAAKLAGDGGHGNAELMPQIEVMRAHIDEARGDPASMQSARERYQWVIANPSHEGSHASAWLATAMLGVAEAHAALGDMDAATEAYTTLVDQVRGGLHSRHVGVGRIVESLLSRYKDRMDNAQTESALRFATLAEKLTGPDKASPDVLLALARAHATLAGEIIKAALKSGDEAASLSQLDPAAQAQAREHLIPAGRYFRLHADRVVLTDDNASAASLWAAAESFDRAGDADAAVPAFKQFADSRPSDDRNAEAKFRLGMAHLARGEVDLAAKLFRELIEGRDRAAGSTGGPWADASYVPLARCLLLDANPTNDAEAEQLLGTALSGNFGPDSPTYRSALLELGRVLYENGRDDYVPAIERLGEAVARYPDDPDVEMTRYRLADANRLSASRIAARLLEAMPDSERVELELARRQRLTKSAELFEAARRGLEGVDERRRSGLQELFLRNSYFYLGDCAFDLGQWDVAIRQYDAARERYGSEPAALVAMVQIVSAHLKQGDVRRAAVANERAKNFYKRLPASVWDDPNLPMGQAEWKRWLDASDQLDRAARAQSEGGPGVTADAARPEAP